MWNPSTCDYECNKACSIYEYLDLKNCSYGKHRFSKLTLAYVDEVLNTTGTSFDDEKGTYEKNNCLIHTISLVIIGCHFF